MKNVKLICKHLFLITLIFSYSACAYSQDEKAVRFENTYKLNKTGKLVFKIYDSDLKVNVWSNNEVKLAGEIIITGGKDDDRALLIGAFKDPEVKSEPNSLDIDTQFWKNMMSIGIFTRVSLKNGNKVNVTKFKASYTLWIPESVEFSLNSKYNDVEIADFAGVFNFDVYDSDIRAGNFGNNSVFNAKYSSFILGNGYNASFDIYDCEVSGKNMADVEIISKYSDMTFSTVRSVIIDSYDDDFNFSKCSNIEAVAKYSLFLLGGDMGNSSYDLYDSDVKGGSYKTLDYSAKYSELVADKIGELKIESAYDGTFKIGSVDKLTCTDSKYDDFYLGTVTGRITMTAVYDTQINVDNLPVTFLGFTGDFKYGSVTLKTDPGLKYKLSCNQTYGSLNYPKERFANKPLTYIEKNSKVEFESSTDPDASCEISFTAYDLDFTIK